MKKWISWVVVILVVAVIVGSKGSAFFEPPSSPAVKESPTVTILQPQPQPQEVKNDLQVSAEKLLTHIQQLNFQRYTSTERSHTRSYIIKELRKFGWTPKLEKFSGGVNVFAEHRSTENRDEAILIAAHYDTVATSPGADDNASGVAVLLEIARLFADLPTPRTLQLAFFDKEEAGLMGSRAFVTNTQRLQKLRGVIVMDMVGYACYTVGCQKYPPGLPVKPPSEKGDFLVAVGDTEHLSLLKAFDNAGTTNLPAILTLPIPIKGLLTPDTLRSDHAPFWYQGVGAVLVTDTANLRTPHYHQPSDVPQYIERSFFVGAAQIVVNTTNNLIKDLGLDQE